MTETNTALGLVSAYHAAQPLTSVHGTLCAVLVSAVYLVSEKRTALRAVSVEMKYVLQPVHKVSACGDQSISGYT